MARLTVFVSQKFNSLPYFAVVGMVYRNQTIKRQLLGNYIGKEPFHLPCAKHFSLCIVNYKT